MVVLNLHLHCSDWKKQESKNRIRTLASTMLGHLEPSSSKKFDAPLWASAACLCLAPFACLLTLFSPPCFTLKLAQRSLQNAWASWTWLESVTAGSLKIWCIFLLLCGCLAHFGNLWESSDLWHARHVGAVWVGCQVARYNNTWNTNLSTVTLKSGDGRN